MNIRNALLIAGVSVGVWASMATTAVPAAPVDMQTTATAVPDSPDAIAPSTHGLAAKVIVVDPGHGGPDSGARSRDGLYEKDIDLAVATYLVAYLQQAGAITYMTRSTDTDLADERDRQMGRRHRGDLRNRVQAVVSKQPDMLISIHCNAAPSPVWSGATTIYMKGNEEGRRLALLAQDEFKQHLLPTRRTADEMDTLYLLKRVPGPAMLAEVGFITNPAEAQHLRTAGYQRKIAWCLYVSAIRYFASDGKSNTPVG